MKKFTSTKANPIGKNILWTEEKAKHSQETTRRKQRALQELLYYVDLGKLPTKPYNDSSQHTPFSDFK